MSELQSAQESPEQGKAKAKITPELPRLRISDDWVEARARMCFRALSLGLAAMVLVLTALNLQSVTSIFVDAARVAPTNAQHVMPAGLDTTAETADTGEPPARDPPHAIVAVISILLIGEIVLAIGLVRATFSMKVNSDVSTGPERESPPSSSGLPGIELLKAAADTIKTVLEGLPKR